MTLMYMFLQWLFIELVKQPTKKPVIIQSEVNGVLRCSHKADSYSDCSHARLLLYHQSIVQSNLANPPVNNPQQLFKLMAHITERGRKIEMWREGENDS